MKLEIDQKLAQEILDYLVTKPYGEVAKLVAELAQLKPSIGGDDEDKKRE
jgi:hypothetical protein